jgi:acid phosphatase (class A)
VTNMGKILTAASVVAFSVGMASMAQSASEPSPLTLPPSVSSASRLMSVPGYLPPGEGPDSLLLNPPPPAPGSAAEARDLAAAEAALALHGTPRWDLATQDALLSPETATATFSCAAGFAIDETVTPKLHGLLMRTGSNIARSTSATKAKYKRPRPFTVNGKPMCTPEQDAVLRHDGSYPSGHSALGFGWGLILASAVPDRAAELVARGRAFGDSRRVCNVHWLSDVEEGRIVAAAVVARLHAVPEFQDDLAAAKAEVAALEKREPARNCEAEALALGG